MLYSLRIKIFIDKGKRDEKNICSITDLGLAKPVNETDDNQIYGIMPYVAPEVLQNKPYTQAADIYSLGIIMYEIFTGLPPYAEYAHDVNLALQICQGIRPQFPDQVKYPQLVIDLITKCWEQEPTKRPTAREISNIVGEWFAGNGYQLKIGTEFYHQCEKAEEFNQTLPKEIRYPNYQSPSGVVWSSKPINTQQITQLLRQKTIEEYHTKTLEELTLDNVNLDELSIQENPQEESSQKASSTQRESSTQAQIQIPPKK